jgi:hypothetical protein
LALSGWYFDSDAAACGTSKRRETDIVVVICVNVQQWVGVRWRTSRETGRFTREGGYAMADRFNH